LRIKRSITIKDRENITTWIKSHCKIGKGSDLRAAVEPEWGCQPENSRPRNKTADILNEKEF
jgi:hypothetical protein